MIDAKHNVRGMGWIFLRMYTIGVIEITMVVGKYWDLPMAYGRGRMNIWIGLLWVEENSWGGQGPSLTIELAECESKPMVRNITKNYKDGEILIFGKREERRWEGWGIEFKKGILLTKPQILNLKAIDEVFKFQ